MKRIKGFIAFGPKDDGVQVWYPPIIKKATPFHGASMIYTPSMKPIQFRPGLGVLFICVKRLKFIRISEVR